MGGRPETGRLKAVGYHTSPESGRDQVKVRLMDKRFDGKYRFWGNGPGGKVQITDTSGCTGQYRCQWVEHREPKPAGRNGSDTGA